MDQSQLTLRECFAFPFAAPRGVADTVEGALWLLTLPIGWVLNLGHRLDVVHRLFHDKPPYFQGFRPYGRTFVRGLKAALAIAVYLCPAVLLSLLVLFVQDTTVQMLAGGAAVVCFVLAVFSLPGGMTYNAAFNDLTYLYRPDKAFRRARQGGRLYLKAWGIALLAVSLSFLGLLAFGIGFLFTSVWAWQVVGFAFSRAIVISQMNPPQAFRET